MPRPRRLPEQGIRRTITFSLELDEKVAVMAAQRRVPISTIVSVLVEQGLRPPATPESLSVEFPAGWEGADLRERIYYLRMKQAELAEAIGASESTMNRWVCDRIISDRKAIPRIQEALRNHIPPPIEAFRTGSRSPVA